MAWRFKDLKSLLLRHPVQVNNPLEIFISFLKKMNSLQKFVSLLLLGACLAVPLDPVLVEQLDKFIEDDWMKDIDVPGMALVITLDDEIVLAKGYGYANVARGIKTDNTSIFGTGSNSKGVLSTVVVKILNEKFPELGRDVLDTPIRELAPGFNFSFIDRYRYESMSFRDLLSHYHCVCNSQLNLLVGACKSREEFNYRLRYEGQCCRYRTAQSYSNTIYTLAASAIAYIAEGDVDTVVVNTLREFGMPYALYYRSDGRHETLPNIAQGYYWMDGENFLFNITLMRKMYLAPGGGGLAASALDMGAYMLMHLNDGVVNGKQVMTKEALNWAYEVSIPYGFGGHKQNENSQVTGAYGYGLGITDQIYEGWRWLSHAGIIGPYNAKYSMFHGKKLGIWSAVNQGTRTHRGHDEVHVGIFQALKALEGGNPELVKEAFKKGPKNLSPIDEIERNSWLPNINNVDQESIMGNRDSWVKEWIPVENVTGIYGSRLDGEVEITLGEEPGTLKFAYGIWGHGIMRPDTDENRYKIQWTTDISHQFYAAGWGDRQYGVHFPDVNTITLLQDGGGLVQFKRDSLLTNEPEHPWAPESCGS